MAFVATIHLLIDDPEIYEESAACDYISETLRDLRAIKDWGYMNGGFPAPFEMKEKYAEGDFLEAADNRCIATLPAEEPWAV
jgi:hypothetical protein